ncbi:MAG: 1-acyl-sn-glycerol-3-phosphate acyltransferase [Vicinamibacterales bacterium]
MTKIRSSEDLARAVIARPEVARLLETGYSQDPAKVRERVLAYLEELRTTQRYPFYRALQHPLYPILRKVTRHEEHIEIVRDAVEDHRIVYASNHRSHLDYLVEPLVLDDNGIRPPLIAAGINLFGGPLGLIHKHVTGAVPIRRATKDPVYLTTLKAYVAELLRDHDLFFYPEGGRSYSGEMKPHKTGILHAVLQSGVRNVLLVPVAIAYDLVLEDRAVSRQGVKKRQRPFTHELAEMVGLAVGYRSRAFVTFGPPVAIGAYDPDSRKDALDLAHLTRDTIGRLYKVLPTAIVATAMRPSITPADLGSRVDAALEHLHAAGANLLVGDVKHAVEDGVSRLEQRGVIQAGVGRLRVRDRNVLRYYARSIQHLLPASPSR